jgi:hypothetical protein
VRSFWSCAEKQINQDKETNHAQRRPVSAAEIVGQPSRINDVKINPVSRKPNEINELAEKPDAENYAESMT